MLLSTALEIFSERSYEAVSVDDICARANVAHGLLSYHFGGKRQIFAAAVQRAWDDLIAYQRPLETEVTIVERFRGHLSRHFDYFGEYPERFKLMTRVGHADEFVSEVLRGARRNAVKEIEAFLGCSESSPPVLTAAISGWAGFVDTMTLEYIDHSATLNIDDITDMCTQVLVASVRSAGGSRIDAALELEALSQVARQSG
ncbi:TetR/AcrR family transcriptional regulator [Rhodococcus opacus]|nr:TetR/AcrR family transcriptional regulator [Rhodococcus opacus]